MGREALWALDAFAGILSDIYRYTLIYTDILCGREMGREAHLQIKGCIKAVLWLYKGCIKAVLGLYSGSIKAVLGLY